VSVLVPSVATGSSVLGSVVVSAGLVNEVVVVVVPFPDLGEVEVVEVVVVAVVVLVVLLAFFGLML
jgi:hypothetical protein